VAKNLSPITFSANPSPAGWTLDPEAIRSALSLLGCDNMPFQLRVKLSSATRKYGATTWRRKRQNGVVQPVSEVSVTVSRYLSAERATETLWHELTHVSQIMRHGSPEAFAQEYARYSSTKSSVYSGRYERNPFEVEARETAEAYKDCPLTKSAN
jgi:hypothetical protein